MGRISVNESVQWLDVSQTFGKTGVATADWTENMYNNPRLIVDSPVRSSDGDPIDLGTVACRVRDDLLNSQNIRQETIVQCLLDTRDKVLLDDDWLESDWSDW